MNWQKIGQIAKALAGVVVAGGALCGAVAGLATSVEDLRDAIDA